MPNFDNIFAGAVIRLQLTTTRMGNNVLNKKGVIRLVLSGTLVASTFTVVLAPVTSFAAPECPVTSIIGCDALPTAMSVIPANSTFGGGGRGPTKM